MTYLPINEVRTRVLADAADDADALACIATILDLPNPADMPRPGQVVAWTFEQWKSWSAPYGFVETDRTKHCNVLIHTKLPVLKIAQSSTSGDRMSGLAFGKQIRHLFTKELRFLRSLAVCVLEEYPNADTANLVKTLTSAEDRKNWLPHVQQKRAVLVDAKIEQLGKQLTSHLANLAKFDVSPKIALVRAGVETEDVERILMVLKSNLTPKLPNLDDIVECLKDQLESEREEEATEAEAKGQARAAAEAVKAAAAEDVDKCEITYNAESTRGKTRMVAAVRGFHERIAQLSAAAKGLTEALDGALFPAFPTERFRELKAEVKTASSKLNEALANQDVIETANKTLQERVAELESMVAELQHEKAETEKLFNEAAVGPEWKAACIKLVAKLEPMVASNDFLAVAQGVAAARIVLADAKKAIDAGVSPTLV